MTMINNDEVGQNSRVNDREMVGSPNLGGAPQIAMGAFGLSADSTVMREPAARSIFSEFKSTKPALQPPHPEKLASKERLAARTAMGELQTWLRSFENSPKFKQLMHGNLQAKLMQTISELAALMFQDASFKADRQAEATQKAHMEVIKQATEAAEAGILGKIFGWIGRLFAMIALAITAAALSASGQAVLAAMVVVALVLTVIDALGTLSKDLGGPDLTIAGIVAKYAEIFGCEKTVVDALRQWLGLSLQILVALLGAIGGIGGGAKMAEQMSRLTNALLQLGEGCTTLASATTRIVTTLENYELALVEVEQLKSVHFHRWLEKSKDQWLEFVRECTEFLETFFAQESEMLSNANKLQRQIFSNSVNTH